MAKKHDAYAAGKKGYQAGKAIHHSREKSITGKIIWGVGWTDGMLEDQGDKIDKKIGKLIK